jgi:hypothetical protein
MALKGNNRRSRHLKFETWWGLFLKAGFRASAFSSYTIQQAQLLLEFLTKPVQANSPMPYKLLEELTALILGWQDTPVMGVLAWIMLWGVPTIRSGEPLINHMFS